MIRNGGGFFPSPYGSQPFPGPTRNFPVGPSLVPSYFNAGPPQGKARQHSPRPSIDQQSGAQHSQKASVFKLYDLETTKEQSEIVRLIFAFAGVPFKNKHLTHEDWERQKTQFPIDQLPILRVNHQFRIYHLDPIVRFLAREFHLLGTGKHDHVIMDIVLESVRRLLEKIAEVWNSPGSTEERRRQWITDHSATYLNQLEKLYHLFNHHGPLYLGSHVSVADLLVYQTVDSLVKIETKLLDKYPHLKQASRHLEKHPRLSSYFHQEPKQIVVVKQKSPHSSRHATKSPTPASIARRHRSQDGLKSSHHHRHHHHHRRDPSKEPTATPPKKRTSNRSSKSPSISVKEKQRPSIRSLKSPSISTKGKEQPTVVAPKSPDVSIKEKEQPPAISPVSSTKDKPAATPPATPVVMGPERPPPLQTVVASRNDAERPLN